MNRITQLTRGKKITIGIVIIVLVVIVLLLLFSQTPTIISATVSPEVMVRGQDSQVTVTVKVRPFLFIAPKLKAIMMEQGYQGNPKTQDDWVKFFSVYQLNPKVLGRLANTGKDEQGNTVYTGTFTINSPTAQTVQIQPTNMFGMNLLPNSTPQLARIAITTRPVTIPPDPGEAGKATLEGIDSDHDGLRDDVQREIMFLAPESEKLRMGLGQFAKAEQIFASQVSLNKIQSFETVEKSFDGLSCVDALQGFVPPIIVADSMIYHNSSRNIIVTNVVQNTLQRKKIYTQNTKNAVGHNTGFTDIKRCAFNPADYQD